MTLYVHIGRNKAGSSTIQRFASDNQAALRRLGVIYPDIGRFRTGHLQLTRALQSRTADRSPLLQLRDALASDPQGRFLISSEHLFEAQLGGIRRLMDHLGGHNIRIIAYIRDYRPWIRSLYAQQVRPGRTASSFDNFFRAHVWSISAMPALRRWARVVGWENIRVRSLDPQSLEGGRVTTDFLQALGLPAPDLALQEPSDQNITPPWPVLELQRALSELGYRIESGSDHSHAVKLIVRQFSRFVAEKADAIPAGSYLSMAQQRFAWRRYNRDVSIINRRTGSSIPKAPLPAASERPFLPSFGEVPLELRSEFVNRLAKRSSWGRLVPGPFGTVHRDVSDLCELIRERYVAEPG